MTREIVPMFPTPIVVTNINRDFTEDELQLFLHDIITYKKQSMYNHKSKDYYLFDSYGTDTLKDIKNFCTDQLEVYLKEIEGVDTDLAGLRITQSWLNRTKPQESHHIHNHPNSYLSGVLYVSCLPNDHINLVNQAFEEQNLPFKIVYMDGYDGEGGWTLGADDRFDEEISNILEIEH